MTPEQQMQAIVEAAGECWHDTNYCDYACEDFSRCSKCMIPRPNNPSPCDLNELFRLADKIDVELISVNKWEGTRGVYHEIIFNGPKNQEVRSVKAATRADALREALYQAVTA